MEIREIRPDEHDALSALTVAAYRSLDPHLPADYEEELADVASRARDAVVLVAEEDGQLLAGVTYIPDNTNPLAEHDDPHAASIRMLAVAPEAHRRGLGRKLTEACTARAASEGKESLILHTVDTNVAAQQFYEALGFDRAPELDVEPVPGIRLLGMRIEVAFGG